MSIIERTKVMLAEYGVPVVLTRETSGEVDPVTGKRANPTVETINGYGVATNDSSALASAIRGAPVADAVYMVDADLVGVVGDKVTINDKTFTLMKTETTVYKGAQAYHTFHLVA